MGCPHDINVRAGPQCSAPATSARHLATGERPRAFKIIVILTLGHTVVSSPFHPGGIWHHLYQKPGKHFPAPPRTLLPSMGRRTKEEGWFIPRAGFTEHLRNTLCKCLLLQHVAFVAKAPKLPATSPLASLSPQREEGLRVRGGHIQSRLPSVSSCISPIRSPG